MNKEVKVQWLAALRSGNYKQGRVYLKTEDKKFCCLGVLSEILNEEWSKIPLKLKYSKVRVYTNSFGLSAALAMNIREKSQLQTDDICVLINMNDNENKSFAEIADYIEREL